MRTRIHKWLDMRQRNSNKTVRITAAIKYGVQVYHRGKWMHTHRNGKPCIYPTMERAEKERERIRKEAT